MIKIAVFAAILAIAYASAPAHYGQTHNAAHVNYVNGLRQRAVNRIAEHTGAGTGTADKYGVPGANYGYHGHPGFHAGFAGYGYGHGYGYQDNAARQLYVNRQAQAVGAGIGTADVHGVPGAYTNQGYGRYH